MADQFKASVRFEASDADSVWSLSEYVARYVNDMLNSLDAYVGPPRISLRAIDGSIVERDGISALRAAAREHHLEPESVHAGFVAKRGVVPPDPGNELEDLKFGIEVDLFPDLTVDVWGNLRAAPRPRLYVDVDLESADKMLLDALKARLIAERDHIAAHGTDALPSAAAVELTSSPAPTILALEEAPAVTQTNETTSTWLRRTWRDHTAAFLYTVAGGLIVVLLGVWLGLSH